RDDRRSGQSGDLRVQPTIRCDQRCRSPSGWRSGSSVLLIMTATPNHSGERGASRRSVVRDDPAECAVPARPAGCETVQQEGIEMKTVCLPGVIALLLALPLAGCGKRVA